MNMNEMENRTIIRCSLQLDETGSSEEFTSDLGYVAKSDNLSHLTSDGLPKIGTRVRPGLLLVGKVGARLSDARGSLDEIDRLTATESELRDYYRKWQYDGSMYAPEGCFGVVVAAYFERTGKVQQAIVEIAKEQTDGFGESS